MSAHGECIDSLVQLIKDLSICFGIAAFDVAISLAAASRSMHDRCVLAGITRNYDQQVLLLPSFQCLGWLLVVSQARTLLGGLASAGLAKKVAALLHADDANRRQHYHDVTSLTPFQVSSTCWQVAAS